MVTALIMACIRNLIEEDMFGRAVEAMDRYTKAMEMWFPEEFVNACDDEMMKDLQEIQATGLMDKFYEFYPEY